MHEKSIQLLNEALIDELSAVHQYMYFHFHCDDQGYDPLSALFKQKAIDEMLHAERIAERVLFLKGDVEMEPIAKVQRVQEPAQMLELAKSMEEGAVQMYNRSATECAQNGDSGSKKLFEDLIADEERHYGNFETQVEYLKKFGEQFLALQSMDRVRQMNTRPATEP